jgi:O-antigen/teichoic acid export membrane protein
MDVFVLGKLVSVEQLGLYSVALGFAQIPVSLAMGFVNPVLLPTYAQVQGDPIAFGRRVLKSSRYLALAFLPLLALMAGGAGTLLELLYGAQYAVMDFVLVLLCIGVAARIMGWTFGTAYLAGGVPGLQRTTSLIRFFLKGVAIVPFTLLWGLEGAAVAGIVPQLAALIYNLRNIHTLAMVSPVAYAMAVAPALALALCLGLGSWAALGSVVK